MPLWKIIFVTALAIPASMTEGSKRFDGFTGLSPTDVKTGESPVSVGVFLLLNPERKRSVVITRCTPVRLNPENPRNLFEPSVIDARGKKGPSRCRGLTSGADHALRDFCYVGCLRTFLTLDDLELHTIALGQRFETAA